MSGAPEIPARLYKYRAFTVPCLRLLTAHEFWYADPASFNDPFDCAPEIEADLGLKDLARLFRAMFPPEKAEEAAQRLGDHDYMSTEIGDWRTNGEARRYLSRRIADDILAHLRREIGPKGVYSFSERWDSPLMWSHYGDSHRGLCVGFDTTEIAHPDLAPVQYGGPRVIRASDLLAWKLGKDAGAGKRVMQALFYAKARDWDYEAEWRDLRNRVGAADGAYRIREIHFGLRCDYAVKVAIVRMLGRDSPVQFYDIRRRADRFDLSRVETESDEIEALGLRGPMEILVHQAFDPLPEITPPEAG